VARAWNLRHRQAGPRRPVCLVRLPGRVRDVTIGGRRVSAARRMASAVALTTVQRYRAAARTCSSQAVWRFPYPTGMAPRRFASPRGWYLAAEVGQLVGVSGDRIGQWARHGYIRSSVSTGSPRVYSFQDVAEAMAVHELLRRGVRHEEIRRSEADEVEWQGWPGVPAPSTPAVVRDLHGCQAACRR
jgi:hypothetical protein